MLIPSRLALQVLLALCITGRVADGQSADSTVAAPQPSTRLEGTLLDADGRLELGATAVTNDSGAFVFVGAAPGWYTLMARRVGFQLTTFDVEVRERATTRVRYRLPRIGQVLDTVRVTGRAVPRRLADFERRRRVSVGGTFFTEEDIRRYDPNVLTDLVRRVISVDVAIDEKGDPVLLSRRGGAGITSTSACPLRFIVDGLPLPSGTSPNLFSPRAIAAVEVYAGPASIPLEFGLTGPNAGCGVVVIWLH
jgi:hypothetical protein